MQHDRHHEVQLGVPRRMSRRRSADAAARRSTARLSAARILRIGTAGPRNARKFACMRLLTRHGRIRPARTLSRAPSARAQAAILRTNAQPAHAPLALTRCGDDPNLGQADIEIQLNHSPLRGRADALGGRALYPAPPAHPRRTPPPRNLCWHARVRRARGRSEARVGPTQPEPPRG